MENINLRDYVVLVDEKGKPYSDNPKNFGKGSEERKKATRAKHEKIYKKYLSGVDVRVLASKYNLTTNYIKQLISQERCKNI